MDQLIFEPNINDLNIIIIGSGNIAYHLCKAFSKTDINIDGLHARNEKEGLRLAKMSKCAYYPHISEIPENCDIYLICVSDDAIKNVVDHLPDHIKKQRIVAHTSGSKSMEETMKTCNNAGVFYPLQTFTKGKRMTYRAIPFCINGKNEDTRQTLSLLANKISESVQFIDDEQRKNIHLSAVLINNFVNHLIHASELLLKKKSIDPSILQPLLLETIKKQKSLGALEAQTGPARRMDSKTIAAHLDLLKNHPAFQKIYDALTRSIQQTYNPKK